MLSDFIVSGLVWKEIDGRKSFSAQTIIFDPSSSKMYDHVQYLGSKSEVVPTYTFIMGPSKPICAGCFVF